MTAFSPNDLLPSRAQCQQLALLLALATRRELLSGAGSLPQPFLHGAGTDGSELRDYQPTDDARFIRWASVAANAPITTRNLHPEQDIERFIALDVSRSLTHSSATWLLAVRTAALFCALSAFDQANATLLLFSDRPELRLTVRPGQRQLQHAIATMLAAPATARPQTDLAHFCTAIAKLNKRPARIVLISDFLPHAPSPAVLHPLAAQNQLFLALIQPPLARELQALAETEVQDAETGQRTVWQPHQLQRLLDAQETHHQQLQLLAGQAGATLLHLDGSLAPADVLRHALAHQRQRRHISQNRLRNL